MTQHQAVRATAVDADRQAPPPRDLAPFAADDFKAAFRHHPGGVAVITATGPGGHVALTATSVSSVSAEPPLLVFSVSAQSSAAPTIRSADHVVVHLLGADELELARLGATSGIDRFADTSLWTTIVTGEPVFHGTRWLRSRVIDRLDSGTATIVVAQAVQSNISADEPRGEDDGLVYVDRTWHRLGSASRLDA
ncbi:MAG: flavin reductase family protein [Microbacterium sp.]